MYLYIYSYSYLSYPTLIYRMYNCVMTYALWVCVGLDVAAVTQLVVEAVRERDGPEFTPHTHTLETNTTQVLP